LTISHGPQNFCHFFPSKDTTRQEGTIFHTTALRVFPLVHQQTNKSATLLSITQDSPKRLKNVQSRRRRSKDCTFLLHIQHLSITMTYLFLRLSIVRVFPRALDQAKKGRPKRNLRLPNTLPRERRDIVTNKDTIVLLKIKVES
jgi:hypothetical protein